ncbi:MAG: hypothetical protein ACK55O_11680, partial [Phycisphaerales bacterium]
YTNKMSFQARAFYKKKLGCLVREPSRTDSTPKLVESEAQDRRHAATSAATLVPCAERPALSPSHKQSRSDVGDNSHTY